MSTGNINLDILLSGLENDAISGSLEAVKHIQKLFPSLSEKEAADIHRLVITEVNKPKDAVSLVITAPPSFAIREKATKVTVESMISRAMRSIMITGYSLTDYFKDAIDLIISKSQKGVFVQFFVNDIENQKSVDKLLRYRGNFLKIYDYSKRNDSMAALHAKVISVDQKETLITSANLSYHDQEGNIELGTHIISENIAKRLDNVLTSLIFNNVFKEIK